MLPLFDYANRGRFVHQVFDNKERISPKSVYRIATSAMFGETELGEARFHYSPVASDHAIGMDDKEGYYCTYCPPVEGIMPGRFLLHPQADAEYKASRPY